MTWSGEAEIRGAAGPLVLLFLVGCLVTCAHARAWAGPDPESGADNTPADAAGLHLSLEQALSLALRYNRSLRAAALGVEGDRAGLRAAEADFDIRVTPLSSINYSSTTGDQQAVWQLGGAVSRRFTTGIRLELRPSVDVSDEEYGAGIGFSLSVPLLRGFGRDTVLDTVYSREYDLRSAGRALHRKRVNTMLATVEAVYNCVLDRKLIELYRDQIALLEGHLRTTRVRERAGIARSMDVYRAEIRVRQVRDSLNRARERAANDADRLKKLTALPMQRRITVSAPLEYTLIDLGQEEALRIAMEHRVELLQGREEIAEARRREAVARRNILPDLRLEADYSRRGSNRYRDTFLFDEDIWSLSLASSTDLARTAEKEAWARSRLEVSRRRLDFAGLREQIAAEVRMVLNRLHKLEAQIRLRREQILQARGRQELALVKFRYREADNFDLIEAQTELQRARAALLAEEIRYIVDGYRLRAALGTLLAYDPADTAVQRGGD